MTIYPKSRIHGQSEPHFPGDRHRLRRPIDRGDTRLVRRDQHLLQAGAPIAHPWLVVAGMLKSYRLDADGEEQVLDFHVPGDIIGLEAVVQATADHSIIALDTCNVRALPADVSAVDATEAESYTQMIIDGMYQEILRLTRRLNMSVEPTDQRLAGWLLEFSEAQRRRGLKPYEFRLPMRRRDLALYLGLATETLSRAFTRLRNRGLVAVNNYEIRILDAEGLGALAGKDREAAHADQAKG